MRTRGQRRARRASPLREPTLLSPPQMLGVIVFGALLCFALWVAFSQRSSFGTSASSQSTPSARRLDVPQQVIATSVGQPNEINGSELFVSSPGTGFQRCGEIRINCVVDGDTFWYEGVKIRVADVDAPEIGRPRCAQEHQLGILATTYLVEFLNGGEFDLHRTTGHHQDRYGRELYVLKRGDRSFGDDLVSQGLGHRWNGYKQSWCGRTAATNPHSVEP
jgi:endonuclease YncB( thermonuclease family)